VLDSDRPLSDLLGRVIDQASQLLGSDGCCVYRFHPETEVLEVAAATGSISCDGALPVSQRDDPVVRALAGRTPVPVARDETGGALLAVPLLLRAPGRVPRGFVVDEISQLTDVAPTILSLARVAAPDAPMQGRALLRDGAATPGPSFAFAEAFRREPGDPRRKAIRNGRAQFVWRTDEANAFFDVARDGEVGPDRLAAEVTRADLLRRALFEWLASSERWARDHGLGGSRGAAPGGARDASAE